MVLYDIEVGISEVDYTISNIEFNGYTLVDLQSDCCNVAVKNNEMQYGDLIQIYGVDPHTGIENSLDSDEDLRNLLKLCEGSRIVKFRIMLIPKESQISQSQNMVQYVNVEPNMVFPIEVQNIGEGFNILGGEYQMTDDEGQNAGERYSGSDGEFSNVGSGSGYDRSESENEEVGLSRLSKEMKGNEFRVGPEGRIELKVGDVFESVAHFREVLKDYTIKEGFEPDKLKNDKRRVTAKCSVDGCPWRIHASLLPDGVTFQIKTHTPDHNCPRNLRKNKQATSTWIAKKLERELRQNPDKPIKDMADDLHDFYEIEVNDQRLYRARKKGKTKFEGDHASSYNKLKTYAAVVRQYNRGSLTTLSFHDRHVIDSSGKLSDPIFKRFFLAFPAPRNAFLKACRPFIGLDGCFLKGNYKGMLLSAVTLDGNNGIIPLAIMVAEGESKDSWGQFLELLDTFIGQCDGKNLTFMSDRQKGILDALGKYFPNANSRFCAMHMYNNFQAKFPGMKLRSLFWSVVRETTEIKFQRKMEEIKLHHKEAYEWLSQIPPKHWALHTMPESIKSAHVCNNMSESFNNWLIKNRSQPVLTLMENFRRRVMKRFSKRNEKAFNWKTVVTPKVRDQLEINKKNSRSCRMTVVGGLVFEIKDGSLYFVVNLNERTCNYREWTLSGIPCRHAIPAIQWMRGNLELFCDDYLTKETYLKTYAENIMPLPDESMWANVESETILPPLVKTMPGRPKKKRKRGKNEPTQRKRGHETSHGDEFKPMKRSSIVRCGLCKGIGHNKRSYTSQGETSSQNLQ